MGNMLIVRPMNTPAICEPLEDGDLLAKFTEANRALVRRGLETIRRHDSTITCSALELGRVFTEMKLVLPREEFALLCESTGRNKRMVQIEMRLFRYWGEHGDLVRGQPVSFLNKLVGKKVPDYFREWVLDDLRAGKQIDRDFVLEQIDAVAGKHKRPLGESSSEPQKDQKTPSRAIALRARNDSLTVVGTESASVGEASHTVQGLVEHRPPADFDITQGLKRIAAQEAFGQDSPAAEATSKSSAACMPHALTEGDAALSNSSGLHNIAEPASSLISVRDHMQPRVEHRAGCAESTSSQVGVLSTEAEARQGLTEMEVSAVLLILARVYDASGTLLGLLEGADPQRFVGALRTALRRVRS